MEQQQHGMSDLTPRAGSDRLLKSSKSLLSALQLMFILCQINTQKYGSGNFDTFEIAIKIRSIVGPLRNHSDQSEHVPRILKLYFCLFQRMKYFFPIFSSDFVMYYYQSN